MNKIFIAIVISILHIFVHIRFYFLSIRGEGMRIQTCDRVRLSGTGDDFLPRDPGSDEQMQPGHIVQPLTIVIHIYMFFK